MKKIFGHLEIITSQPVQLIVKKLFKNEETEIVERPASFILKLKKEPEDKVFRIILLPPYGCTANKLNQTSPHPEVRRAKLEIKGGVRPGKYSFNPLKKFLKFAYFTKRNIKVIGNEPYPRINKNDKTYLERIKSSREKFFVVKENGEGFYHNLINLSEEWTLLILEKELRPEKTPDINSKIRNINKSQQKLISGLFKKIQLLGDGIFKKEKQLISNVISLNATISILPLIEMLNVLETGRHEPCTVYAIILKIGKKDKRVTDYLREAVKNKEAPKYYLDELIKKLSR